MIADFAGQRVFSVFANIFSISPKPEYLVPVVQQLSPGHRYIGIVTKLLKSRKCGSSCRYI